MSIAELALYVGKQGFLSVEGLQVPVKVLDVRQSWGNVHILVTPIKGEGKKWVDSNRFAEVVE